MIKDKVVRIGYKEFIVLNEFKREMGTESYPETFRTLFREWERKNEKPPKFRF